MALQTWSPDLDVAFGLNGPGWSIGVEFFLYALFPLLLWAVLRIPRRAWLWVGVGAVILLTLVTGSLYLARTNLLPWADPASAHRWLYRTPLTRIPDFTVGIVIALIVKNSGSQRWASAVQWLSVVTFLALMSSDRMLFSIVSWDIGYLVPSTALIRSLAAAPHAPACAPAERPAAGARRHHQLRLVPVPGAVDTRNAGLLRGGGMGAWAAGVAMTLFIVLGVASGAHHMIEVPAQRWLRQRRQFLGPTPSALRPGKA